MSFGDCKKIGLIKKDLNAHKRVENEINSAQHFFKSALNIFKIKEYDLTIIASYNSSFHFLRALLFKNNYIEKSHYCLVEALRKLYFNNKGFLDLLDEFDKIRMSRHEIQYRGVFSDKEEARYVLNFNKRLKKYMLEKLIKF